MVEVVYLGSILTFRVLVSGHRRVEKGILEGAYLLPLEAELDRLELETLG